MANDPLRRLRWQCRRGLLELDVLLENFLEKQYLSLSAEEQAKFKTLLHCSDQDLLYWFTNQSEPPPELKEIISAIKIPLFLRERALLNK